jgi:hypothetical protein
MPKLRFDRKAVAGFFVSHVEKMVLAVVLVLFAIFVYSGYSLDGLPSGRSPEELSRAVDQAEDYMNSDTWAQRADSKGHTITTGHADRAKKTQSETTLHSYASHKPFLPPDRPSGVKRTDPEILAPIELETTVVVGPMALQLQEGEIDLLAELDGTEMRIKKKKKKKKSKESRRAAMFDMMAPEEEVIMEDNISGGGPDIAGEGEEDLADAIDRIFPGYRPLDLESIGRSQVVVAVKALVPYRQQWDKFDQALASAMHYNSGRDFPQYVFFYAERAEVPADPDGELKWRVISHTDYEWERSQSAEQRWAGTGKDVVGPRYTAPALTMPIPPIMMRNPADFALHSKIQRYYEEDPGVGAAEEEEELGRSLDELLTASPVVALGASGNMGSTAASSAASAFSAAVGGPQVDNLMLRFFDVLDLAELGKQYRYRVQVWVEDPNHPRDSRLTPRDRTLSEGVRDRITEVVKQEDADGVDRIGYVKSAFSEPSDIVTIELPRTTLAGVISNSGGRLKIPGSPVSVPISEPKAKVLSIVYDGVHSVDVPGFFDAQRGTVLDFTKDADVVHPVTLQFKKLDRFAVKTDHLLVDFRGGDVLPKLEEPKKQVKRKRRKDKEEDKEEEEEEKEEVELYSASEFIFLDRDGTFFVRNDLDDFDDYELYVVPERIEEEE